MNSGFDLDYKSFTRPWVGCAWRPLHCLLFEGELGQHRPQTWSVAGEGDPADHDTAWRTDVMPRCELEAGDGRYGPRRLRYDDGNTEEELAAAGPIEQRCQAPAPRARLVYLRGTLIIS